MYITKTNSINILECPKHKALMSNAMTLNPEIFRIDIFEEMIKEINAGESPFVDALECLYHINEAAYDQYGDGTIDYATYQTIIEMQHDIHTVVNAAGDTFYNQ